MTTIEITTTLATVICGECGMLFAMPGELMRELQRDHGTFYCPSGHARYFSGESDVEKLQRELKATKQHASEMREWGEAEAERRRLAERSLKTTRSQLTKTKNRIAHGVCPCCKRTFQDLARHMAGQHPDYEVTDKD